ncbi:MAG: FtsQ-type POTRA domain-containing protein [Clostridia bacterium]
MKIMFKVLNKKVEESIEQNPYIENVKITKTISGTVNLEVTERVATYMLKFANGYVYINNQGYMLEISQEPQELPIISGFKTPIENIKEGNRLVVEDLKELENVIKIMEIAKTTSVGAIIAEIDISDPTNYKIIIPSENKTVEFGDLTNINVKILKIEYIIEQEKGKQGEIYFQGAEKAVFREKKYKEVKNLNKSKIAIILGTVCMLLTISIAVQMRTIEKATNTVGTGISDNSGLKDEFLKNQDEYNTVYKKLEEAEKKLEEVRNQATQNNETDTNIEAEIKEDRRLSRTNRSNRTRFDNKS